MMESAYEMFQNADRVVRNRYRLEYLDYMLRVLEQAKQEGDNRTVGNALMSCAHWMYAAGRLKEALDYFRQRLDPAVLPLDKLEIRCTKEFISEIEQELGSEQR